MTTISVNPWELQRVPSAETLRQRLDEVAPTLRRIADACSVGFSEKSPGDHLPFRYGTYPPGLRCLSHGQLQDQKGRSVPYLQRGGRVCAHGGVSGHGRVVPGVGVA